MAFLNPLILIGLAAAAIPLIIHLFNFRKPRRVNFSSLAFLQELKKSTMQRVRIKQWLLLALRTLAIACLVLAFARPTLRGSLGGLLGGHGSSSVAVIVDNSLSMTLRDSGGEYLDQAKAIASGIVGQLGQGDEVYVLPVADDRLVQPAAFRSRGAALDAIGKIDTENRTASIQAAIERAAAVLAEGHSLNREVYVVTDLQRSTLTDSAGIELPDGTRLYVLPVGGRTYDNVAVTDVQIASRIVEVGQPVQIRATLSNYGTDAVQDYVASLYLEGQKVAQAAADLEPGAETTVTLTATPQKRGWLAGTVQLEDDAFPFDNTRYFSLNVPAHRKLLVVQGEGQTMDYLDLALSPGLAQGRIAFDKEAVPESRLAAASLASYDAVLLVGPRNLSSGEIAALAQYVGNGGGLLLFPSSTAQSADYNALLTAIGGGRVGGFTGSRGGETIPIASFDRVDLEHPLFQGMFDRTAASRGRTQVESPDVYYTMTYTPGRGNEQTLVRLSNGHPFLEEIRHGRGIAFFMSVAPDPAWSDLPTRGLFVPLLYRSVFYLSAGETVAGEQFTVGTPAELRVPGINENAPAKLVSPQGEEYAPGQRMLLGTALLQIDGSLDTPGVYDVRMGNQTLRRVAFNLDRRESDLTLLEPAEARRVLSQHVDGPVDVLGSAGQQVERVIQAVGEQRYGTELWNVFLGLALLFLIAEMLVARRWRPETVTA
ncbi:MAG TPA: BatA domain-containing protein [Rhodothermales bacterium]|nr:BatA domain-containing protein [Rhodothermales bacterium]